MAWWYVKLWCSNGMSTWGGGGTCDGSKAMLPEVEACRHLGEGSDVI